MITSQLPNEAQLLQAGEEMYHALRYLGRESGAGEH
jgi:hypothetical protein